MLYILPASSALHFDSQPYYRRVTRPAFSPDYLDYNEYFAAEMDQAALAREVLRRYEEEQRIRIQRQAEELARRRLIESVVAAERREIARRQKQQLEMEYARAIAIAAARRLHSEESSRREHAVKQHVRQEELNEFQRTLLSLLSHGSAQDQQQVCIRQPPALQRTPAIRRPAPSDPSSEKINARLQGETDPEIADILGNILKALSPERPITASAPAPAAARQDKGKAKEEVAEPIPVKIHDAPRNDRAEELAFHEYLRDFWKPVPRTGEAGPSGTSPAGSPTKERHASSEAVQSTASSTTAQPQQSNSTSTPEPTAAESEAEAAQRIREEAVSSIQQIQNTLHTLESEFNLPPTLDHYPATPDHDDTASVSSAASDMSRLIPFTANNSTVYAYENELGKLLERLDNIESNGDLEVRDARREAVRGVEKALSAVANSVEEEISRNVELLQESEPVEASSSEEVVGYTVDDTVSAEVDMKLEVQETERSGEPEADPEVQEQNVGHRSDDAVFPDAGAQVLTSLESRPSVTSDEVHRVRVTEDLYPDSADIASSSTEAPQDVSVALPAVALESTEFSSSSYELPGAHDALQGDDVISRSSIDAQEVVEEIDTFLLPALKPLSSDDSKVQGDVVGDDDAVIVDGDKSGDEWTQVDA